MTKLNRVPSKSGLLALLFSMLMLFGGFSYADITRDPAAGEKLVTLTVERMTWAGCVVAVSKALTTLEGVKEIEVDLDEKTAIVIYETAKVSIAKLTAATTDVGFPSTVKLAAN